MKPSPRSADPTAQHSTGAVHSSARRDARSVDVVAILDALGALDRALRLESSTAGRLVGMSGAQWRALLAIAEMPACSVTDVARRTHTDVSSLSAVVKRLEAGGFVTRTVPAGDRRRVTTDLTARGRAVVGRVTGPGATRSGRATAALSPRVRRALAADAASLVTALRALGTAT